MAEIFPKGGVNLKMIDTILCDQVCQWLAVGRWFSVGTPVSSIDITDRHDIAEILLKLALNTISLTLTLISSDFRFTEIVTCYYIVPL